MALTESVMKKYLQDRYIETGCAGGDSLQVALDCGAVQIDGIEINPELFEISRKRFSNRKMVTIHHGYSERVLAKILFECRERCLIYLDAHRVSPNGPGNYPLMKELEIIKLYGKPRHTIMIDDIRLCGGILPPKEILLKFFHAFDSAYNIAYEDSLTDEKDTMVAYI